MSETCKYFNPLAKHHKTGLMCVECQYPHKKHISQCPFITDIKTDCCIKELILEMKCCPSCNYNFSWGYRENSNDIRIICHHCRKKFLPSEILAYKELIQLKNLKRLAAVWFYK